MQTAKIQSNQIRAMINPDSWNEDERTIDVVFATSNPVLRRGWDGDYNEVLSMESKHIRMERVNSGAPVLDSHSTWELESQMGVVERAWIEAGELKATLRLSARESLKEIVQDIKDKIIRNISVGYRVYRYEQTEGGEGLTPTYTATDWEPYEISFVTVPADHKAGTRNAELQENEVTIITTNQTPQMEKEPVKVVDTEAVQRAIELEKSRTLDIMELVRIHNLPTEFGADAIKAGTDIANFRAAVLDQLAKKTPETISAKVGEDRNAAHENRATEAALMLRIGQATSEFNSAEIKAAQALASRGLVGIAERSLQRKGINTEHMSKMEIATRAITQGTSDFPVLMESVLNKTLKANYDLAADTWRRFCATGLLTDFRPHYRYEQGEFGVLQKVVENAEYNNVAIADGAKESITGDTYGNLINLSRQAIINDDLSAFATLAARYGRTAALTIEQSVYDLLTSNSGLGPTMTDGNTLFHANHNNIGTGAAISVSSIDADRVKMAQQKDLNDKTFLDLRPQVLVLPIGLGGTAKVLNQSQFDNDVTGKYAQPNKVVGLFSDIVDSPRLSGTRRYMFANPAIAPVIEVGFLNGVQAPYTEMQEAFTQDGVAWKIRLDFGVAAVGYRGAVTNAGV